MGRIILIIVVILLVAIGATFFLLPSSASRTETLAIDRPAGTVLARLASTPPGASLGEGITLTEITSSDENSVTGTVAYADGETGRVTYTVTPEGEGSSVEVKLEQNLGMNPIARFQGMNGAAVEPRIATAASAVTADLSALPNATFAGLQYNVVQVQAQPFFYVQNCSPTDAESVTSVVQQALVAVNAVMVANRLVATGNPIAVEPRVEDNQYCYQVGYPYSGTPPRVLAIGAAGQTPAGTALRVVYTGTEEDVIAQVYDPLDALLAAAHLDDPTTREDDWVTFEVYHDDPTQEGGSRMREIFYVAEGDVARLTQIAPPAAETIALPTAEPAQTEEAPAAEEGEAAGANAEAAETPETEPAE